MSKNKSKITEKNKNIKIVLVVAILSLVPIYIFTPWSSLNIRKNKQKNASHHEDLNPGEFIGSSQHNDDKTEKDSREKQPEKSNDEPRNNDNSKNAYNTEDEVKIKDSVSKEEPQAKKMNINSEKDHYRKKETVTADELLELKQTLNQKMLPLIQKLNLFIASFYEHIEKEYPIVLHIVDPAIGKCFKTEDMDNSACKDIEVDTQRYKDLNEIDNWNLSNGKFKKRKTESEYDFIMSLYVFVKNVMDEIQLLKKIDKNINKLDKYLFIEKRSIIFYLNISLMLI